MDVHVPAAISRGLRRCGLDVLTAQADGTAEWNDAPLLDRAGELGRLVFTCDEDFLAEAVKRQRSGVDFATVIYARMRDLTIGGAIEDLSLLSGALLEAEWRGLIVYLPL
jgi:hypothetical protein